MPTVHKGQRIVESSTLVIKACGTCGCLYGIPESMEYRAHQDSDVWWYCPNGHRWHYTDTNEARLERQLRSEQARASSLADQLGAAEAEVAHQAAKARGYKGAMVQTKKRAAKGVCPVPGCRRHFVDVERHVASKHPGWDGES